MPCTSTDFFGDVQIGDFTLTRQQLEDVLEPERERQAFTKDQIRAVIEDPNASYRRIM